MSLRICATVHHSKQINTASQGIILLVQSILVYPIDVFCNLKLQSFSFHREDMTDMN